MTTSGNDLQQSEPSTQPERQQAARSVPLYRDAVRQFEIGYLRLVLDASEGNLSRAARLAQVDRTTLIRMLDRHGLKRALDGRLAA